MIVSTKNPVVVYTLPASYTLTVNQEELDMIEAICSNTSGAGGLSNRIARSLQGYRTPRALYSVTISGIKYKSVDNMGIHFAPAFDS